MLPDRDGRAVRTRDLDEAIDAVTKVYCPHTIEVMGRARGIDALLNVRYSTFQPLVGLSYSTPVKIDAQNMSRLFLMMHCASGAASTTQEHRTGDWKTGQTMPFSANFDTKLWFDRAFMQKSVRLDMNRLEAQCARWLGYPLVERLRFDLRPVSDPLEQIWQRALAYGWSSEARGPARRRREDRIGRIPADALTASSSAQLQRWAGAGRANTGTWHRASRRTVLD